MLLSVKQSIEENLEHIFGWNPEYEYADYYKTSGHAHNSTF